MSGHPHQGGYDDGYNQQQYHGNDAYYQEEHQQQGYGHESYDYTTSSTPNSKAIMEEIGYYDES